MAKFKEGNIVKVITSGHIGVVIDYIAKDRLSVDFGKPIGAVVIDECDLELISKAVGISVSKTADVIEALKPKPIMSSTGYENCLTDPNVDYEALSEEPVYYEFIDIGKALNKLKKYEHLGCKTSDSEEVIYIVNKKYPKIAHPHLVLKKEYNGRDLVKYTVKNHLNQQFDIRPMDKGMAIFTNLKEAISYIELVNKFDDLEDTPF